MILRSTHWEGEPPAPGDVVHVPGQGVAVVTAVAEGPGLGHWRIDCAPARLITWYPEP